VIFLKVNFGGFVPLSTVDWRGRAVCVVFLRGCPVCCHYCHNTALREGEDLRDPEEIVSLMESSRMLVSGVIFSGGEPTMQKDPLLLLAARARRLGFRVGIHTNGVFPETIQALIEERLLDRVALDIKTRWERYNDLLKRPYVKRVQRSLAICRQAHADGSLPEFEIVVTLFRGCEDDLPEIAREAEGVDLVLQQGVIQSLAPLSGEELAAAAKSLSRRVIIRTREDGEIVCGGSASPPADPKRYPADTETER